MGTMRATLNVASLCLHSQLHPISPTILGFHVRAMNSLVRPSGHMAEEPSDLEADGWVVIPTENCDWCSDDLPEEAPSAVATVLHTSAVATVLHTEAWALGLRTSAVAASSGGKGASGIAAASQAGLSCGPPSHLAAGCCVAVGADADNLRLAADLWLAAALLGPPMGGTAHRGGLRPCLRRAHALSTGLR